jgi:hypothetical protein
MSPNWTLAARPHATKKSHRSRTALILYQNSPRLTGCWTDLSYVGLPQRRAFYLLSSVALNWLAGISHTHDSVGKDAIVSLFREQFSVPFLGKIC